MKVITVFGTRPEAIKMAPVIKALEQSPYIDSRVCITAQHREMLDQVLEIFEITPDYDLNIMQQGQSLSDITSKVLKAMEAVFDKENPDIILVHGDTSTTLSASMAAYYKKIPVAHIEAGLRTDDLYAPWPEEGNRRMVAALSQLHFAPTQNACDNLVAENIPQDRIIVTGNTVIDALLSLTDKIDTNNTLNTTLKGQFEFLREDAKTVLITGHRRENFGAGFHNICQAVARLSHMFPEVDFVYPVHLNPNVSLPVRNLLSGISNVHLIQPLSYLPFVWLMKNSHLILTDSGGIQEEAPALGKPVLVMREVTERPEALKAGTARLVGTHIEKIVFGAAELLTDEKTYMKMSKAVNPFGDGSAALRIVDTLEAYAGRDGEGNEHRAGLAAQ